MASSNSRSRSRSKSRGRSRSRSASSSSSSSSSSRSASRSKSRSRSRSRSSSRNRKPTKIMVQQLTKNVKKEHLQEIFSLYGKVVYVDLPVDRRSGVHKGTGYVEFSGPEEAEKAKTYMDEAQIDGAVINVFYVIPPSMKRPVNRSNRRGSGAPFRGGFRPRRRYSPRRRDSPSPQRRKRSFSPRRRRRSSSRSSSSRSPSRRR